VDVLQRPGRAVSISSCSTSAVVFPPTTTTRSLLQETRQNVELRVGPPFPRTIEILAEPGRFLVASAVTAVAQIIGKSVRGGKLCYYLNDGVYQTYSGQIFDHAQYHLNSFKDGPTQFCAVFGPTCDALDTSAWSNSFRSWTWANWSTPKLGAYSSASSNTSTAFRRPRSCM